WVAYLKGTGWYRYFFPAHTLLYLFFPASVLFISTLAKNSVFKRSLFCVPIFIIVFQFYHLIFLSSTPFILHQTRNSELKEALEQIDSSKNIFFHNAPEAVVFFRGA